MLTSLSQLPLVPKSINIHIMTNLMIPIFNFFVFIYLCIVNFVLVIFNLFRFAINYDEIKDWQKIY